MDSLRGTKEIPYVMLEHLSWNHKEFLNLVEKRLVTVCEHAEWHGMPRAYNLVRSLLSIQDDLQHEREVRIVQIFVEAIVHSKNISSAVTQYNLYELMTLACQNDGVLTELRSGKYTKEILPSFAKWLDVEKEEQVVPVSESKRVRRAQAAALHGEHPAKSASGKSPSTKGFPHGPVLRGRQSKDILFSMDHHRAADCNGGVRAGCVQGACVCCAGKATVRNPATGVPCLIRRSASFVKKGFLNR